jgi:Kef-type K+ transport system membrane component KefB
MLLVPLLARWAHTKIHSSAVVFFVIVAGALGCAVAAEWIGLHLIFGAFLFGVVMPRCGVETPHDEVERRIAPLSAVFMPIYFVVTGFGVDLSKVGAQGLGVVDLPVM